MTLPGQRQATSASRSPLRLPSGWGCRELYLWQSYPAQKISEARIGAEVVEPGVNIDIDDYPFRKPLLQSSKCCIFFVQHRVITGRKVVVAFSAAIFSTSPQVSRIALLLEDSHEFIGTRFVPPQSFDFDPLFHCRFVVPQLLIA